MLCACCSSVCMTTLFLPLIVMKVAVRHQHIARTLLVAFSSRLRLLLFLALITSASGMIAASLALEALNDLKKYLKAASVLIVQASTGLYRTKFATISTYPRNPHATLPRRRPAKGTRSLLPH